MERAPKPPAPNAPPLVAPKLSSPEVGSFERSRGRKRAKQPEQSQQPQAASPENQPNPQSPEAPKKVGEAVFKFLFGDKQPVQPEQTLPAQPEVLAPVIDRATRTRRFARHVINRVLGVASAEQKIAASANQNPLDTQPLVVAAGDLRGAATSLGGAMRAAGDTAPAAVDFKPERSDTGGSYDAEPVSVTARITDRISVLERSAEKDRATAVVAIGLGVLAVMVAGHEYLARKKIERKHGALQKKSTMQQREMARQEAAFASLQEKQQDVAHMARRERKNYYEQLSEFTHQQADATRQVAREVREHIAAPAPEAAALLARAELVPRHETSRRTPELPTARRPETAPRPEPLVRVEHADKIEQGPARFSAQNAGLNAGGGAGGVPGNDFGVPAVPAKAPLSPAALREQAARKARAARLASNAWIYGTVLGLTMIGIVAAIIFLG